MFRERDEWEPLRPVHLSVDKIFPPNSWSTGDRFHGIPLYTLSWNIYVSELESDCINYQASAKRSQHANWTQHIATLLGATCCVRLAILSRHVGCCWLKFENGQIWANNTQQGGQTHTTCCANNVTMCCVGMLRSFSRGFRIHMEFQTKSSSRFVQFGFSPTFKGVRGSASIS